MSKLGVDIARAAVKVVGRLPLKVHYVFADFIAWLAGKVVRYRNDVIMINLSRSFPEKKYRELQKIRDDYYRHFAEIFAEAIWFGASNYKRLHDSGIVTVTNPEILGGFLGYRTHEDIRLDLQEEQIKVVYKGLHSSFANKFFLLNRVAPLEKVDFSCEIEASRILRYAIEHRKEKNVYIYIADQYPYRAAHDVGTFLNQDTKAMLGAAGVACKLGHSVVYLKMRRVERGRYEMTLIPICMNASEQTPEQITRKYFDLLEEEICETPANWLWSHKRWK